MLSQPVKSGRTLIADLKFYRVAAWACIALFSLASFMSWRAGQGDVSPWFLIFVALGVVLLVITGSIEMNAQSVTYKCPWGTYVIEWNDVECIEVDAQGGVLALIGKEKRLSLIGPAHWGGKDKPEMLALLASKIEEKSIPVQETQRALFRSSKNTKVR